MTTAGDRHRFFAAGGSWALAAILLTVLLPDAASARTADPILNIGGYQYDQDQATQLQLPKALREISGLTFDDAGLLYAHNDERGVIYQIDYAAGLVRKRFLLKGVNGGIRADFEGIAYLAPQLYLISSTGYLYETRVGDAEEQVTFRKLTEGLPCEVEGLSASKDTGSLLAACKNHSDGKADVRVYRWVRGTGDWEVEPAIQIPKSTWQKFVRASGLKIGGKLQPTGLSRTPTGNLILLAGRQNLLLEVTPEGEPVRAAGLDPDRHRQPEGIAMNELGHLLIADEGDSKGNKKSRGVLTVHEPAR